MEMNMRASLPGLAVAAFLLTSVLPGAAALAQRPARAPATRDPGAAAAGTYKLDPDHTSVVVRVPHEGMSFSTFRFNVVSGTLNWNPGQLQSSKVDITVDPKSIATPVAGFGDQLSGERFLNSAKFSEVKFVSTAIRQTGPTSGEITGELTFLGQTKPLVIAAELVGAGSNMRGVSSIGFKGSAKFNRTDFGMRTMTPVVGDEVELVIDTQFNRQG
jgi:polyisoprenoid-binding protein YceI